jgi:chromosome segregation ATPase
MEYAQLESRISFLDTEYRREKSELAQLKHQLELSEAEKEEMSKRIEALEAELLEIKTHLSKIESLEGIIERFKGEMLNALEEQRLTQKRVLKDAERARAIELDSHTKAINEIRRKLEQQRNLDELVTLARTETDRQGAVLVSFQQRLDNLAKQTDEHLRSVSYLEEQRRTDTKRISELKVETTDLFKQTAMQLSKIELLEQQIPQFGQFQAELAKVKESIRAEVERAQYQHARVERTVKSWDTLSETVQRRLEEYEARMERYAEQYQRNLKALEELQSFQERLKRDQHEFMELHRLNADRQKNQFEEWQSVQEQTLRKQALESERKMADMLKKIEKLEKDLTDTVIDLPDLRNQITLLLKIAEEDAIHRTIAARDWQVRFEQLATEESE